MNLVAGIVAVRTVDGGSAGLGASREEPHLWSVSSLDEMNPSQNTMKQLARSTSVVIETMLMHQSR